MPSAVSRTPIERMAVGVGKLQHDIMTGIAKGAALVFDPVADGHNSGLTKSGLGLIF